MSINHPSVKFIDGTCPTCFEKIQTQCCLTRHVCHCKGRQKCNSCSQLIIARRGKKLEELVAQHKCDEKKCLMCYEDVELANAKTHCCQMAPVTFPRGYNQQGYFDVETFQEPNNNLRDNVVHFCYESQLAGIFNGITFTHEGLQHPFSSIIRKNVFVYDYLPKSIGNEIDKKTGLIKPQGKKRKKNGDADDDGEDEDLEFQHQHWDLQSYIRLTKDKTEDLLEDYEAYHRNLKKYHDRVPRTMRNRPLFKFLCFILNDRHRNRTICSHFGSRFDMIMVCEFLLKLRIQPQILPQGNGILQLVIKEFNILFLDSYKFFPQSLSSLSKRFDLKSTVKGYFPHTFNRPENWGLIRKKPPPMEEYLSQRDSEDVRKAKITWWLEDKSKQPEYNFNHDIVKYCIDDVNLFMTACTRFIQQSMDFGQELIQRFGQSPAFRQGLCQPHFHPFNAGIPTLGSYG